MKYDHVDFAAIVDHLISWSQDRQGELSMHEPGDQHTIGFSIAGSGHILWRVYPRQGDGAKVSILTHWLRQQPQSVRERIAPFVAAVSTRVEFREGKELDVPLHLLATTERMTAFLALLEEGLAIVESQCTP